MNTAQRSFANGGPIGAARKTLVIEPGKTYRRRDGQSQLIDVVLPDKYQTVHPCIGLHFGSRHTWRRDGFYAGPSDPRPEDLVAERDEPKQVPFTFDTVPSDHWFRLEKGRTPSRVMHVYESGVVLMRSPGPNNLISFSELASVGWQHAPKHNSPEAEWLPCTTVEIP